MLRCFSMSVMLACLTGLLALSVSSADAQLLRRRAAPAPAVVVPADPPAAAPAAGVGVHPVVKLFIRQHVIAGLVEKGMPRAKARQIADDHLTDEFLAAAMADHGMKMPAAPPPGGWLSWILSVMPQIMDLITKLIALFGGLGFITPDGMSLLLDLIKLHALLQELALAA